MASTTAAVGQPITAALWNTAVGNTPKAKISNSVTQTLTTSATTYGMVFDTEDFDTDSMGDTANEQLVVNTDGLYRITAQATFAANATGRRSVYLKAGPSSSLTYFGFAQIPAGTSAVVSVQVVGFKSLSVGDVIRADLNQNSGGSLATDNSYGGCWLAAERIGS